MLSNFQVNQQTAFLDLSQVYGPTIEKADSLRSHTLGRLKTETIDGLEFGVQEKRNGSTFCSGRPNVTFCFDRGTVKTKNITNMEIIMIFKNVVFRRS